MRTRCGNDSSQTIHFARSTVMECDRVPRYGHEVMRVAVVSNIPHYHYLASALQRAGMLGRYVTSIALFPGDQAPKWLGHYWRRKLEGRMLEGVPKSSVTRIRVPEMCQRALPMMKLLSRERANCFNNYWFDMAAARHIHDCDVVHV